ncbi:NAD(P)-binding protein [Aspergillus germanicus]
MAPSVVLITGANRGIEKGILKLYLKKPNHTVIAAIRDPTHPTAEALTEIPISAAGTKLHLVKVEATSPTDPFDAVNELAFRGIHHIDIVIANAGIALGWEKVRDADPEIIQKHVDVNVYGFLYLYQSFRNLLKEATDPKWVTIGSGAALTPSTNYIPLHNALYAPTKLVQHWYTRAIAAEDDFVATDLGKRGANLLGMETAPVTVEDSAAGIVKAIDESTRDTHSGKIFTYEGNEVAW